MARLGVESVAVVAARAVVKAALRGAPNVAHFPSCQPNGVCEVGKCGHLLSLFLLLSF